jgi:hypothetical protein
MLRERKLDVIIITNGRPKPKFGMLSLIWKRSECVFQDSAVNVSSLHSSVFKPDFTFPS